MLVRPRVEGAILPSRRGSGNRRHFTARHGIAADTALCRLPARTVTATLIVPAPHRSQRQGGEQMRTKLMWFAGLAAIVMSAAPYVENAWATDPSGFTGTTVAQGRFGDIDVANQVLREFGDLTPQRDLWLSLQKTKGPSDLFVQNNEWAVGGSSGWHTHPGHSLIIVTAGAVSAYDADDPSCTPTVYSSKAVNGIANMGFVDSGGDHVHLLRNEGLIVARTVAVQLIPAGAGRRSGVTP